MPTHSTVAYILLSLYTGAGDEAGFEAGEGMGSSKNTRYAIPPILITELLTACNN